MAESKGTTYLCSKYELPDLLALAERTKERTLKDLRLFCRGDVDIHIHEVRNVMGYSIAATLLVNGTAVREYDPADLCFLDLNNLMFERLLETKKGEGN